MVSQELPKAHASALGADRPQSATPCADEADEASWEHVPAVAAAAHLSSPVQQGTRSLDPNNGGDALNVVVTDQNVWDDARLDGAPKPSGPFEEIQPAGNRAATNPFLKRKPVPQVAAESLPLADGLSKLDTNDTSRSPGSRQQTGDERLHPGPEPQQVKLDSLASDPWAVEEQQPAALQPNIPSDSPALISFPLENDEAPVWNEEKPLKDQANAPSGQPSVALSTDLLENKTVWNDHGLHDKGKGKRLETPANGQAATDEWSLIDSEPSEKAPVRAEIFPNEKPPLPARSTGAQQKWTPSRPPVDVMAETYQVKLIRWHDEKCDKNPRTSPILIQNENGPCPLVALVNALTMTTAPDGQDATLVEVLRSREEISLDLLLKAVFDELMSPTRTNSEVALPDVSDLYGFLQSLHTGMNVNPRFVPTPEMLNAYRRTTLTNLDPNERGNLIPGTFENTMEMSLYATFSIPLIHGWLPAQEDAVHDAFERRAASYEDVQNLLFREEELEELLGGRGLSEDEQQLYEDIAVIKMFLDSSATQLTEWGIEVIGKAMRPGTFAILFRNDHFSTLYCHPHTLQLLSLVTDAGYRSHDEVVWETLADVNGERTKYLSGDFRVVGSSTESGSSNVNLNSSTTDRGGDWTEVEKKGGKDRELPVSPHEQEDRDLALALQLQEEEDQRHRAEQYRRRRESILSEQYIEQQGHRPSLVNRDRRRPSHASNIAPERRSSNVQTIPVTVSSSSQPRQPGTPHIVPRMSQPQQQPQQQQQQVRPLVPPRRPAVAPRADSNGDDAPPPYEQAAQDAAYVPSSETPNHPPIRAAPMGRVPPQPLARQPIRRQLTSADVPSGRDRDCILM
ncbi:DUF455 domain protein [Moelleriella libera RCEF 2490]|uniref:DUF455 domain protein n=1 Tax=Moelleriella libera RCEF 2490 TaxID=1081109 RepID=A0A166RPY9_9HYPO|nr:DUF455 domain protein [Moelleriella libera RCEF 2490]